LQPDRDHNGAIAIADGKSAAGRAECRLRPMVERDIHPVVCLIGRAMNSDEGRQAQETFHFHFSCKHHGLNDGRRYYVLMDDSYIAGIAGLHHYVWGPPENVWLAWFAVEPELHARGLGTFLLDAITREARQLGYTTLFVETYSTPDFAQARRFYQAKGFTEAGHVRAYLGNAGDMIVFSKDLTNHV
jgi:GNAT superfamily N-acetyltransferase